MASRTTRRRFIADAAVTTIGAWVTSRSASAQGASPNEQVHVASIGVGGRGAADLDGVGGQPGVDVVALCDVDDNHLGNAAKKFPGAKTYSDFRKMFDEMHKDIDAVTVGTPDHIHAPAAVMAMKHGKHCYCEKPLTHSIHEARTMAKVAAEKKVVTQMGNQGHAGQGVRRIVEIVQAGVVGPIKEAVAWTNRPVWPQGLDRPAGEKPVPSHLHWDLWLGPAPERPYNDGYHPFAWRGWWDFGTGALGDMACHILDAIFWSLKLGHPVSAEAEGAPLKPECAPNWQTVKLAFPARGSMPPVKLTWYDGKLQKDGREVPNLPPAELFKGVRPAGGGSLLIGEKGTIYIPDDYCGRHLLLPQEAFQGFKAPAPKIPNAPGDSPHAEFVEAIRDKKRKCGSNFVDYSGQMTESILLGVVAFRTGRKIEWDGPNLKAKNCPEAAPLIKREYRKGWTL